MTVVEIFLSLVLFQAVILMAVISVSLCWLTRIAVAWVSLQVQAYEDDKKMKLEMLNLTRENMEKMVKAVRDNSVMHPTHVQADHIKRTIPVQ